MSVRIRSEDLPGVGAGGEAETDGDESVEVLVEDTNLPAGIYFAHSIYLQGDGPGKYGGYIAKIAESQYFQGILTRPNGVENCLTDFAAAQFRVTSEASDQP
ncbi:MAG: hypothetical protein ACN4G0_00285 [Polyangiales bacterium]